MRRAAASMRHHRVEVVAGTTGGGLGTERLQHMFHEHRHVKEAYRAGEEGVERRFLGSVKDGAGEAAHVEHLPRQPERGEPLGVGRGEVEPAEGGEIEPVDRQLPPRPAS